MNTKNNQNTNNNNKNLSDTANYRRPVKPQKLVKRVEPDQENTDNNKDKLSSTGAVQAAQENKDDLDATRVILRPKRDQGRTEIKSSHKAEQSFNTASNSPNTSKNGIKAAKPVDYKNFEVIKSEPNDRQALEYVNKEDVRKAARKMRTTDTISVKPVYNDSQERSYQTQSVDSREVYTASEAQPAADIETRRIDLSALNKTDLDKNNQEYSSKSRAGQYSNKEAVSAQPKSWSNTNINTNTDVKISYDEKSDQQSTKAIEHAAKLTVLNSAKTKIPWYSRFNRKGPNKEYRLKGYANAEYAKQVRQKKQTTIRWGYLLFWILVIVLLFVLLYSLHLVENINQLIHMLGMD